MTEARESWHRAQVAEARFHANPARRARERLQRAFYSGMMECGEAGPQTSIMDIGCGPESLLLTVPRAAKTVRVAVDPLTFENEDEQRYSDAGIRRLYDPAESIIAAPDLDEVWMYNVLQHVQDPTTVIDVATRYAPLLRLFEWVDQPLSTVHIHAFSADFIRKELTRRGFMPYRETQGQSRLVGKWDQAFYAGVWKK